jgi:hypothetical protein
LLGNFPTFLPSVSLKLKVWQARGYESKTR